jgi:2-succinyl-5-enolpyruvyl-6-hydroxy-3-cyclohexene-1-carboxylate synthase
VTPGDVAPASSWSLHFLEGLVSRGVRDIVVSPGARSQALALVAAAFADRQLVDLHVVIDERVAAFLALGIAVESKRPVAILTTSGTAVANLHPGVLEAHHAGVPLIVITADRPASLRHAGVNQTTNQVGIFADAARASFDIPPPEAHNVRSAIQVADDVVTAAVRESGPVHLNVQFVPPLSSPLDARLFDGIRAGALPLTSRAESGVGVVAAPGTVVVAGYGAGSRAEKWARELGAPLIAEISSGAHFGPHLVTDYRRLLQLPEFANAINSVVVVGRPTLSREVEALCSRQDLDVIVVRGPEAMPYRPNPRALVVDTINIEGRGEDYSQRWALPWARLSRAGLDQQNTDPAADVEGSVAETHAERASFARNEMEIQRESVTPEMLVRAVWDATWPHDRIVFGASRLIRVADSILPGKPLRVHSNRGLSGIDGTIATAAGIAIASQSDAFATQGGVTRLILGDLAAQHDIGALAVVKGRIQIIVGNDGGGRIFDDLVVAAESNPNHFERVMRTPQDISFEGVARAFNLGHVKVTNRGDLTTALTNTARPTLVEVALPKN